MYELKRLLASMNLHIEDNQTISKSSGGVKSVVTCNKKPIVLSNGSFGEFSFRNRSQNIVFNTHSKMKDCSFLFLEKQIHEALSAKINILMVEILKTLETPEEYNLVRSQKLKKLFLKLIKEEKVEFDKTCKNSLSNKWIKLYEKMSERPLQDGLVRLNPKLGNVCVDDEKLIEYYKKIYQPHNSDNILFVYFSSYMYVDFPFYQILSTTKDRVLGLEFEKNELEILKSVFQYIFSNIDKKNAYSFLDKTLMEDKLQGGIENVYVVENMENITTPTILLIETFNSLATCIDAVMDDVYESKELSEKFNLNITSTEMERLKVYSESMPNYPESTNHFQAELNLNPRIKFEDFNKQLNEHCNKVDKSHLKVSHEPKFKKSIVAITPVQSFELSSIGTKEFENSLYVLDSATESFKRKIPDKERKRHTYMLAGSGSGKTSLLETFLYQDCQATNQSTIIFDLMGKATRSVIKFVDDSERVLIVDPYMHSSITPIINPFELEMRDELSIENRTKAIINAFDIALQLKDGWSVNMKAVLAPCISTLLRKGDSDIYELQQFMNDEVNEGLVKLGKESPIRGHKSFFQQEFNNESYEITKRAISAKLQVFLNDPSFASLVTGKSTINLKKEVNTKGKIIIFKLPSKQKLFARLMMEMIQDIMRERINLSEDEIVPTHIYLDEFQNYLTPTIEEVLSESRNYKFYVTFAHQSFVHLSRKIQGIVLSNSNIKIVGQCSYDDAKKMSKEIKADLETIQALEQGEFIFKVGSKSPAQWRNTDRFINDNTPYHTKQRTKHMKYQFKKYYVYKEDASCVVKHNGTEMTFQPKYEEF